MSQEVRRCAGTTADGTSCDVPPGLVLDSGFCLRHSPDPQDRALAAAGSLKGALSTKARAKRGLDPGELGELETAEDALRWCATVAAAVAEGRLSASVGQTVARLVAEWRSARDLHLREGRLSELERELGRRSRIGVIR
jgi:hypothetical protein